MSTSIAQTGSFAVAIVVPPGTERGRHRCRPPWCALRVGYAGGSAFAAGAAGAARAAGAAGRAAGHRAGLRAHERAHVLGGVREQRHVAGALERRGEHPLVLRAGAALAARVDLAAVADVAADAADFLEVDLLDLVHAERADL